MNRSASAVLPLFWLGPAFAQTTQSEPVAASIPTSVFVVLVIAYILLACFLVGIMIWRISRGEKKTRQQEIR